MKHLRGTALLCAVCLMPAGTAFMAEPAAVCAAAEEQAAFEGLLYEAAAGSVTVTGYTDDLPEEVIIPAEINGLPVTKIKEKAFSYCSNITKLVLPESIAEIGAEAFRNCYHLKSAELPESLTILPRNLFDECKRLESVKFSAKTETIGDQAFARCEMLAEIEIPATAVNLGEDVFSGTAWLKAKRLENPFVVVNRILIDGHACSGDITLPDTADYVGAGAFSYNYDIVNVVIPAHIRSIGRYGFFYCPALKSVTILNPECEIYDMDGTISNQYAKHKAGMVDCEIRCFANSTAHEFAKQREYPFTLMESAAFLRGDFNGNGKVESNDAQDVLNAYVMSLAGVELYMTELQQKACDINSDGKTDVSDAQMILLYYVRQSVAAESVTWEDILK